VTFVLLGCTQPGLLATVQDELARDVLDRSGYSTRLFVGVMGVLAETCATDAVDGYAFSGAAAGALGVYAAEVVRNDDGSKELTFAAVGLDGTEGDLTVDVDSTESTYTTTYYDENRSLKLNLGFAACTTERAIVSGSGAAVFDGETAKLTSLGNSPFVGVEWSPPTADLPSAGWAHWVSAGEDESITLDSAENIDADELLWPATVKGRSWSREASILMPQG
jgi:hypothetical protein